MTEKEMQNQIIYWKKNPDKFAEWILGYKLPWYKKLWFKLFSNIKNDNKSIEEIYCPDCAHKNGLNWHIFVKYSGLPRKYKCKYCGREYYENEDE